MRNAENICLNCEYQLDTELYCPNCGQKTHSHNLSLKYLLSYFYIAFIDFDKKILRSLRDIWIPNKISNSFLAGGRQQYGNHLRFFVICLVLFFGLIALNMRQLDLNSDDLARTAIKSQLYQDLEAFEDEHPFTCDSLILDSLKYSLFRSGNTSDDTISYNSDDDLISFQFNKNEFEFDVNDFYSLSQDSIFSKYKINDKYYQFIAGQGLKVIKNGGSLLNFAIGNMFWGLLLMTIIMAVFLKLVYIRHKSFYAEHLIQMISYHCIFCLLMSIALLINLFTSIHPLFYFLIVLVSGLHLSISLKRYYSDSWLKIIIKSFLLILAYLISFNMIIILILAISVIFF